jgi:hypothetical protein
MECEGWRGPKSEFLQPFPSLVVMDGREALTLCRNRYSRHQPDTRGSYSSAGVGTDGRESLTIPNGRLGGPTAESGRTGSHHQGIMIGEAVRLLVGAAVRLWSRDGRGARVHLGNTPAAMTEGIVGRRPSVLHPPAVMLKR